MLGDNCTRLAVKLLTSISLGRGAQLAQDTVRMCVCIDDTWIQSFENICIFFIEAMECVKKMFLCGSEFLKKCVCVCRVSQTLDMVTS